MLDLRLIRRDPQAVRTALARRGPHAVERLERVVELDARWREATQAAEALRAEQKAASEEVAAGKREGRDVGGTLEHLKVLSGEVKARGEQAREAEAELQEVLRTLPNLPDPTAAEPEDEVLRIVGEERRRLDGRDHLELAGERIDMERGARLSGARFPILRGDLVMLELALVQWVMAKLRDGHGFEPVIPPVPPPPPAYFARNAATLRASSPVTMFSGMIAPEKPPFWIAKRTSSSVSLRSSKFGPSSRSRSVTSNVEPCVPAVLSV